MDSTYSIMSDEALIVKGNDDTEKEETTRKKEIEKGIEIQLGKSKEECSDLLRILKECRDEEIVFPCYNGRNKCTWTADIARENPSASPHCEFDRPPVKSNTIMENVLEAIGNTPMIRLSKFKRKYNLKCDLVAKCEFLSAGGSVKDRIGKRMIEEAEKTGRIKKGDTLIEPTSGNTGIGLALAALVKDYRLVITLPEKMSEEKLNVMKLLGAEILRTPTEAAWNAPESHIGLALKLQKHLKNSCILDQYLNPSNPLAHYETTAEEIIEQCNGKVDMIVMTVGTGGTITGISRKIKEKLPHCKIVGVDPHGSILAEPPELNEKHKDVHYKVEGIGYDFIPTVLDRSVIDEWIKTNDQESFELARELIKLEGLLCGGSSGSAMKGVLSKAKDLNENQRCVVLLPDSCRNYMTKFISDDWMKLNGFLNHQEDMASKEKSLWRNKRVCDLTLKPSITVMPNASISYCVPIFCQKQVDQVLVVTESDVIGILSVADIFSYIDEGKAQMTDSVSVAVNKVFKTVRMDTLLHELSCLFRANPYVVVTSEINTYTGEKQICTKKHTSNIITRLDLLRFINEQL